MEELDKVGLKDDWQLLWETDRGFVADEVLWATNELHGILLR